MASQGGAIWVGESTASRTKKLLLAMIDGAAYAQRSVSHEASIQKMWSALLFVTLESKVTSKSCEPST